MIDAHVHFGSVPGSGKNWGNFKEYKEIANRLGISRYCVTPIGLPDNFTTHSTPDNYSVLNELKNNKNIIPKYWFNVFDLPKGIDKKFRAIKFHPDIGEISIDDKRVINFVKKINLPVFVHTNESKEFSSLEKVCNLAKQVKVPVIAVHSGSVTRTFFRIDKYNFPKNVYFETSGIQYAIILKKIYGKFGAKRIIFGSDYPFGDPRVSLAMIESLNPGKKEYELMTEKNISKILNL